MRQSIKYGGVYLPSPHVNAKAAPSWARWGSCDVCFILKQLSEELQPIRTRVGGKNLPKFTSKPGLPPRGGGGAQQLGDQSSVVSRVCHFSLKHDDIIAEAMSHGVFRTLL